MPTPNLVSTEWLAENLGKPGIVVVDASFHTGPTRDALTEYSQGHIPGAIFFNIDEVKDRENPFPHMVPSAEVFAKDISAMGISNSDHVIAYDTIGIQSSPRVWWLLRLFGHEKVSVLDGGMPKWLAEGRPVLAEATTLPPSTFTAVEPKTGRVVKYEDIVRFLHNPSSAPQMVDARSVDRYHGRGLEPRIVVSGGEMLPAEELRKLFDSANVDLDKPIITTCGSGVTACGVALALEQLGVLSVPIYDGSWTEFSGRAEEDGLPFEKGPTRKSWDD